MLARRPRARARLGQPRRRRRGPAPARRRPLLANSSWIRARPAAWSPARPPSAACLVLGVDGRQPDDPRAPRAPRSRRRLRVQPADARVERDRAERVDPGHRRAHDRGALGGRHVVRLEHEAREPELGEAARQRRGRRCAASRGRARRARAGRRRRARARARAARTGSQWPAVAVKRAVLLGHRRRALDVERRDGLHAPGLALGALGLRPHDRLVLGVEEQEAAGADLDAVAARLVGVEEERLLDRVLVRPRLDHDAVLEEDVGGAQHVLALSTKKAMWCSRPRRPAWRRACRSGRRTSVEASQTPASVPSSSTICSVSRRPRKRSQKTRLAPESTARRLTWSRCATPTPRPG